MLVNDSDQTTVESTKTSIDISFELVSAAYQKLSSVFSPNVKTGVSIIVPAAEAEIQFDPECGDPYQLRIQPVFVQSLGIPSSNPSSINVTKSLVLPASSFVSAEIVGKKATNTNIPITI